VTSKIILGRIGKNVRQQRINRKISLYKLSNLLCIAPDFLDSIERGKRDATCRVLFRLAEVFECTIDRLFAESPQAKVDNAIQRDYPYDS